MLSSHHRRHGHCRHSCCCDSRQHDSAASCQHLDCSTPPSQPTTHCAHTRHTSHHNRRTNQRPAVPSAACSTAGGWGPCGQRQHSTAQQLTVPRQATCRTARSLRPGTRCPQSSVCWCCCRRRTGGGGGGSSSSSGCKSCEQVEAGPANNDNAAAPKKHTSTHTDCP